MPKPFPDEIDVVVCSYAGDDLDLAVSAIGTAVAQLGDRGRVLVIDSWPDASLRERVNDPAVVVEQVAPGTPLGEARQAGVQLSSARRLAFLDSDAIPRPGWLDALAVAVAADDVAVAGGPVLPVWPDGRRVPRAFRTQPAYDFLSMLDLGPATLDVPRVMPGNMVVDRELTGEEVFSRGWGRRGNDLVGAEESLMMLDVLDRGLRIVYEPRGAVDHHTKPERMSWRWMLRRVEAAGREAHLLGRREAPLPRTFTTNDRVFLGTVAPAYFTGRLRALAAARRSR
jgi:hypothetical protein